MKIKKNELLIKSREAMLSAVQIYNNPQITFKAESYITLAIIAWTYLLHTYYANIGVDYRYYEKRGKRKYYDRTKYGAYKHWELERCLNCKKSPIDSITTKNLKFLIGVRHEIEHQMTKQIDDEMSAKLQACSINYNYYIKELFGKNFGVDQELGMAIQFSPIEAEQKSLLMHNKKIGNNIKKFIISFEDELTDDEYKNVRYAYRVVFARVDGKRKNSETDEVIKFIPADDPIAKDINANYTVLKEIEKKKYIASQVVKLMQDEGYDWFTMSHHTSLWKEELKIDRMHSKHVIKLANSWLWYESWIPIVREYCENTEKNNNNK